MKVLVLAPEPWFEERGTPIAVDLVLRALVENGHDVELLTFHLGKDAPTLPPDHIHRIRPWFRIEHVPPGLSLRKVVCDVFMFARFVSLMFRRRYDVVHAVEEASFMAMIVCPLTSTPYVVDMDSSMTTQIVDKYPRLRILRRVLMFLESIPMRFAAVVAPMCDVLADEIRRYSPRRVVVLKDVSLRNELSDGSRAENLRETLGITGRMVMYNGNLESYQGIDLLLESFKRVCRHADDVDLVVIGGTQDDIERYREEAREMGISQYVHFVGPRPVRQLDGYLRQADLLVSPRVQGVNTPMKIFSYLHSGVAVLATRLPTHTQVITPRVAALAEPNGRSFGLAMLDLLDNPAWRRRLAVNARRLIEREHSYSAFKKKIGGIYSRQLKAA
ncbi:MAG: glycosyltransferase family 4 protein [Gammaproteobacteria bacterium]